MAGNFVYFCFYVLIILVVSLHFCCSLKNTMLFYNNMLLQFLSVVLDSLLDLRRRSKFKSKRRLTTLTSICLKRTLLIVNSVSCLTVQFFYFRI